MKDRRCPHCRKPLKLRRSVDDFPPYARLGLTVLRLLRIEANRGVYLRDAGYWTVEVDDELVVTNHRKHDHMKWARGEKLKRSTRAAWLKDNGMYEDDNGRTKEL